MRGLLGRLTRGLTGAGLSGSAPRGTSVAAVSSPPPPSYTLTYAPRQTLASCSFVSSAVTQAGGRGAVGAPLHGSAWTMPTMPFAASGTVGANRSTQRAAPGGTRAKTTGIGLRVMNGDVDRAMRKLKRLMIQEGYFRDRDKRKHFLKGSEKRRIAASDSEHRRWKRSLRRKLRWIQTRRERGF